MRHRTISITLPLAGTVALIALASAIALTACGTSPRIASGTPVDLLTGKSFSECEKLPVGR